MKANLMEAFRQSSYLSGSNAAYIEELYETFLQDPQALSEEWREYFNSFVDAQTATKDVSHAQIRDEFREMAKCPRTLSAPAVAGSKQAAVDNFINAYRRLGHLNAKLDPLGSEGLQDVRLQLSHHQLSDADLNQTFLTRGVLPVDEASLKDIVAALQKLYTNHIGIEYFHIDDEKESAWLRNYVETKLMTPNFDSETKISILKKLIAADGLEKSLDVKYPGQKRFSIEGADAVIPMLDYLAVKSRAKEIHEIVIGMAHRGRLNVLLNILGQSPTELFQEFEGTLDYGMTSGDVKYHRGFSSDMNTPFGPIHLSLGFNPSHLEFINTVVLGSVRARQERENHKSKFDYAIPVLLHGDAAFSGQGIVLETLNMSQTRAYHTGGTIHIVQNNQIGFTTSDPRDSRSSHYCSDVAKMINAPVFHVNGDDVEAAVAVMQLALEYRLQFHKDIVIDLVCYRRHGHQEVDEPRATQPLMYQIINKHPTPVAIYAEQLINEGIVTPDQVKQWQKEYRDALDQGRQVVDLVREGISDHHAANWMPFIDQHWSVSADTSVSKEKLLSLGEKLAVLPEGFKLQRNVGMIMQARKKMTHGELPLDWGYAETMAYATLLTQNYSVRLSGEDSRRGTFFHRHATLFDQNTGATYVPLQHLDEKQAPLHIYDSLLSEAGALGFEYGYATAEPNALVMWEAQFGDFANGAQVIIDQFISSGWQKWKRLSGLVMLLPHGYEGMGPEHSSARLERYLQLCAQDNIQIFVPTTPAQIFHLLRRQVLRPYRKPLIVMTPKSLLRHKLATSTLDELSNGQLQLIIPEIDKINPQKVRRVILCSGKVYYDLLIKRREEKIEDIAIIRVEQLYPFPYDVLRSILRDYSNATELVWCQEEPKNQGAWFTSRHRFRKCFPHPMKLMYAGRGPASAAAAGYPALHKKQQEQLIHDALDL